MFKKYDKIDDYFIDKKQLKEYKKLNDDVFENVFLKFTNKNSESDLYFNIDKFKNSVIIFENCKFNNLRLTEFNKNSNTVKFKNTSITIAEIKLNNSSISMSECEVDNCVINTYGEIVLENIKNKISPFAEINLGLQSCTEKININRIIPNKNSPYKTPIIIINMNANNIKINKSDIHVNITSSKTIMIDNSNISIKNLISDNKIIVNDSVINKSYIKWNGFIKSPFINLLSPYSHNNLIENSVIEANNIVISDDSGLTFQKTYLDITELLVLQKNSRVYCDDDKSILDAEKILMNSNAIVNVNNFKCENINDKYADIELNKLKIERAKLVKTLKLVQDKFNKQIKNL